ncbi:ribonuclease III [Gammaproteobacteria bacterium LSUCC0112]|nr:ribonuclease III [Gammaproteobacteria bacterium LSUCC0112]
MNAKKHAVLDALQTALDYKFKNADLLALALTHRSAGRSHNQRLEFLGDAALGLIMAEMLYQRLPASPEGELSQVRASLVNRSSLAAIARKLDLGNMIELGMGEQKSGGQQRDSILGDALEAIFGALFLDGGIDVCRTCIYKLFDSQLSTGEEQLLINCKDAKTRLQEIMQGRALSLPLYEVKDIRGDEHQQEFEVSCFIPLLKKAVTGQGRSRREAEQHAAQKALDILDTLSGKLTDPR